MISDIFLKIRSRTDWRNRIYSLVIVYAAVVKFGVRPQNIFFFWREEVGSMAVDYDRSPKPF